MMRGRERGGRKAGRKEGREGGREGGRGASGCVLINETCIVYMFIIDYSGI